MSYSLRVGLLVAAGLLVLAVAVVAQTSDAAHAQTDDDPLELASGDCRDYTGGPVPFDGSRAPAFWGTVWAAAVDNGFACDMLSGVGGVTFSIVDGEPESGPNGIPQFRQGDVVRATTDVPTGTTITWSWVPGTPIEGCGTSDPTCQFEVSGVGYRQLGVYQRGACGAIRCLEAAAWKAVYIAGSGTISGQITDGDGEPVAGILLTIVGGDDTDEQVVTDEDGDYRIDVPQGDYIVTPRDYADAYDPEAAQFLQFETPAENVTVDDDVTADFVLRGWELSGVVTEDREDTPVPGVRVRVWRGDRSFTAMTDESGRYEITLPEGSYTVLPRTPIEHDNAAVAGGAFVPNRSSVELTEDIDNADFEVDTTLRLEVELTSSKITVTVLNQEFEPVPDQNVELEGWDFPPWALVCRDDGRRVWPREGPLLGSRIISSSQTQAITAITDDDGKVELRLLTGTQAGDYTVEASIPDSDRDGESDLATTQLSAGGAGIPTFDGLSGSLEEILGSGQTSAGRDGGAVGLDSMLLLLAQNGYRTPYAPIVGLDGGSAGILFYRSTAIDDVAPMLNAFTGSNPAAQAAFEGLVADAGARDRSVVVTTLETWILGDGTFGSANGAIRPGRPGAGDETRLTFWGWPTPPQPSNATNWSVFSRCTGASWGATASTVHSPVNVLYVDPDGNRLGYDADGELFREIAGGFVVGAPGDEPVTYILPIGDYSVEVFGTGSGAATIRFETPGEEGPGYAAFTFDAEDGVGGSIALTGNTPGPVLAYGDELVPATAGLPLSVKGAPTELPLDEWSEVTLEVATSVGQPAAGAIIRVSTPDGSVDSRTIADAAGIATFSLRPLTLGLPLTLEVGGPGYASSTVTIEAGPATPPEPDDVSTAEDSPTATVAPRSDATAVADATTVPEAADVADDEDGSSSAFLIVGVLVLGLVLAGATFLWRRRTAGAA